MLAVIVIAAAPPAFAQRHWKDLTYPLLRDIQVPEVDQMELANGLKLYLLEDHSFPKVEGIALIRTGDRFEPADKVGLAGLVGQVMRTGGTTKHPGEEIDRMLENAGAFVETGIGTTSASASIFALKEDLPMALEILADLLQNPAFPEDKIELSKVQERTAISRRNDDVMGIASREFVKILYGPDSPYGRTTEYATIDAITRDDLIAFHSKYFHPNQTALGLWGDFDKAEVKTLVEKHFGSWERKKVDFPPLPEVPADWKASINFIPKDDVNQTNLRMGHLGGRRDDPDFFAMQVMSEILGGSFSSRLFRRVRTELGLAYAASASWGAGWDRPGSFFIFCNTKSESTLQATEVILKEVRRITVEPVTDDELRVAKEGILNSFVFNFDTTGKIVRRLMTYDYYGYPSDFLQKYKANIEKITPDDILKAAKKHIKPDKLILLAVGRAEDFDKPLSTLGEVNTIDISIPPPKTP
jgi:zinc protease